MKVKSESENVQLCLTRSNPMDRSLPGSSTHGIVQARVLEWVAIASSVKFHMYVFIYCIGVFLSDLLDSVWLQFHPLD